MVVRKYTDIEIDAHLQELHAKREEINAHLQTLTIQQQSLEKFLLQSEEEINKSTRELKKEEQLLSLANNLDEKQKNDLEKATANLSQLEELSKEKLLLALKAKQDAEAANSSYNEQLNAVNQLHLQIASHKNEMADLQEKFKYYSELWQEQSAYVANQTKALENAKAQLNYGTELSKLITNVSRSTKEHSIRPVAQEIVTGLYEGKEPLDLAIAPLPKVALGEQQFNSIQKFISSLNMTDSLEVAPPPVMKNTWVKSEKFEAQKVDMAEELKSDSVASMFSNMTDEEISDAGEIDTAKVENISENITENVAENTVVKADEDADIEPKQKLSFITGEEKDVWSDTHKKSKVRIAFDYLLCIALAIILALICRTFVLIPTNVDGESMASTLHSGEKIVTSPVPYYFGDVNRGDIVVFQAPDQEEGVFYIKRVIAKAGDHLKIAGGCVYLNDEILDEEYLDGMATDGDFYGIVPSGKVFVMGDNREASHDSRSQAVSFIDVGEITSKAVLKVYPFSEFGFIE